MIVIIKQLTFLYGLLNEVAIGKVYYGINYSDDDHSLMPFIVYQEMSKRGVLYADDVAQMRMCTFQITLVTEKKDTSVEEKLERAFKKNGLEYQVVTEYLNSDQSVNRVYEIKMEVLEYE